MMKNKLEIKKDTLDISQTENGNEIIFINGCLLGGENLIKLRGTKSKEEVARECGISLSALTAYENDERVPRDEVKYKLSKYYGITQIKIQLPPTKVKAAIITE